MAGTKEGGRKAARTNKERHGKDFYRNIGRKGGSVTDTNGGFASELIGSDGPTGPERAKKVGAIGDFISRRGPAKQK